METVVGTIRNERGAGLLMALLVLMAIAAIAAGIMASVATDRRLASYNASRALAVDYAEAGVYEAFERIRAGDVPNKQNPKMVAQIFRTPAGVVPAVGTDTMAMSTGQPDGEWLPYSSDTKGPDVLTIRYMTDAARTGIYKYDNTKSPPVQGQTGDPIFIITSPARVGRSRAEIEATVAMQMLHPNLIGAYTADGKITLDGNLFVYGYDYSADTPDGTGSTGVPDPTYQTTNPDIAGAWATGDIALKGPAKAYGTPPTAKKQAGFYSGPWDVLNMSQDEFWTWIGPPNKKLKAPLPRGIIYLGDPKDKPQQGHHKYDIKGGYGDGMLYVNGDLRVNGDFTFRGLIYVEGDIEIKGTAWILGAVVAADNGKAGATHKDPMTILASKEGIQQYLGQYGNPFVTIGWKEN